MAYKTHQFKDKDILTHSDMNNIIAGIDEAKQEASAKQPALVSGVNVKTINGQSILGAGNLNISGGEGSSSSSTSSSAFDLYNQAKATVSRFAHQTSINIEPYGEKDVDLILFTGQSNSCGRAQLSDCKYPEDLLLSVPTYKAFHFNGTSATTPQQIVEPISANGTSAYGYIPAFLNAYYKTTHHQVCACFNSTGGTNLNKFVKYTLDANSEPTTSKNSLYTTAETKVNYAKTQLANLGYTIKGIYVVWCQGENDGYYYGTNTTYCTAKEQSLTTPAAKTAYYKELFRTLVEDWKKDLGVEAVFMISIGHRKVNPADWGIYGPIVQAQKELGKEYDDCVLATTLFTGAEKFIEEDGTVRNLMRDNTHYKPEGYARAGLDAGVNSGIFVNSGKRSKPIIIDYETMMFDTAAGMERPFDKFIYDPCRIDLNLFKQYASEIVTSISLNFDKTTLAVGETVQLTADLYPTTITEKGVTYTNTNSSVATIDANGVITAKAVGTTTITVTPKATSVVTATVTITVLAEKVPVTSITLNYNEASMLVGDTLQLTATVLPDNATDKSITWSSSDAGAASVSSTGLVTALEQGDATITAVANGNPNAKATCVIQLAHKVIAAGETLLDLDFTKQTVNDYVTSGDLIAADADVTNVTYDATNGMSYTNTKGTYGLKLANTIPLNQSLIIDCDLFMDTYENSGTTKTESLYGYLMLASGTDEHTTHGSNCFTPGLYSNKPKLTTRTISGSTVNIGSTGFAQDGQWHSYRMVYDASTQKLSFYIDGALDGEGTVAYTENDIIGYILGTHKGYSGAANYGPCAGMKVRSFKVSRMQ